MDEGQNWLVSFDTDQIKNYIFSTNRLKEIRGASSLLRELDNKRKEWINKVVPEFNEKDGFVYSAGGGMTILVKNESQAKKIITEVCRNFLDKTVTATITGVLLYLAPTIEPFGQQMKQAGEQLRQAKAAKAELTNLPVEPFFHLCDSCEKYPAEKFITGKNNELLCASCAVKRSNGDRSKFYNEFLDYIKEHDKNSQAWIEKMLTEDLDDIGGVAYPPGYIGFIALDGNRMGNLLNKLKKKEDYQEFSKNIDCLVRNQTFTALKKYGQPRPLDTERYVVPFEIVIMGGDDVILITAADIAIEIALSITEGFEESSKSILRMVDGLQDEEKLTMAGGVVLAHAKFPIPAMYKLSEELQKSAKKLCTEKKYETGALDFVVVSSSDSDLEEMRSPIPHYRPYLCKNLRQLIDYVRKFKKEDFPTSQLQTMYQSLFAGEINAQLAAIATLGRLCQSQNENKYNLLRDFFKDFGVAFDGQLPPWTEKKDKKVTALADLVELYPFIRKEGGEK